MVKWLWQGNFNKFKVEGGVLQCNNIYIVICVEGEVEDILKELYYVFEIVKYKVKFILVIDGKDFQVENLNSGEIIVCVYFDFYEYFSFFFELVGISLVKEIWESIFDIKVMGCLNKFYIELLWNNLDWVWLECW